MSVEEKQKLVDNEKKTKHLKAPDELELGEYFLHIYLMETTGLVNNSDAGLDAIIKLEAFGESKYTKVKKDIGEGITSFWGEHFFFQKTFTDRNELENANFEIVVYDHSAILKNSKVGFTNGTASQVYYETDHSVLNKWEILINPEVNYKKPMGFIKYSVNFVKAGEPRKNLELQTFSGKENKFTALSIPPNIKLNQKQIVIKVYRGDRLVRLDDFGGGADPYVKFDLGGLKIKTDYQKSTLIPVFNRILLIPTIYPTIVKNLQMGFKDYDTFGKNEYFGSFDFQLEDIKNGYYKDPKWTYFYGAHEKTMNKKIQKAMNQYSDLASRFKGALLVSIYMEERVETSFRTLEMTREDVDLLKNLEKIEFKAILDLEFVQNLKSKASSHYVEINWGGKIIRSNKTKYNKGVLTFFERLEINETFEIQTKNPNFNNDEELGGMMRSNEDEYIDYMFEQLPDIILSIVHDEKPISYFRFRPENFLATHTNSHNVLSIFLNADNSVSNLKDNVAGNLYLKIGVGNKRDFSNWPRFDTSPKYEKIKILCNLYQGKDLIPMDDDGNSDPIVQFYHLGALQNSSTFPKTLNPNWNEQILLESNSVNGIIPPLILSLWDKDCDIFGNTEHEFMGSTIVQLTDKDVIINENEIRTQKEAKWYDLRIRKDELKGQIMCSFKVLKQDFVYLNIPKRQPINIPKSRHHIKINILGLRNLQSSGLLPIKNTEIKISTSSLKSVEQMQEGAAFTDLVAYSTGGGKNPNIGTVLSLNVFLPNNLTHMPTLSSQVLDRGLKYCGFDQILGIFQINLGNYASISLVSLKAKLDSLDDFLKKKYKDNNEQEVLDRLERNLHSINGIRNQINLSINSNQGSVQIENSQWQQADKKKKFKIRKLESNFVKKEFKNQLNILGIRKPTVLEKPIIEIEGKNIFAKKVTVVDRQNDLTLGEDEIKEIKGNFRAVEQKEEQILLPQGNGGFFSQLNSKMLKNKIAKIAKIQLKLDKIIIKPEFEKIRARNSDGEEEEINIPDPNMYFQIGFISKTKNTKHYRKYLNNELEKSEYMGEELFTTIDIFRGKYMNFEKGFFQKLFSFGLTSEEKLRKTGYFRGIVEVIESTLLNQVIKLELTNKEKKQFEIPSDLEEWKYSKIDEQILKSEDVIIRLYVIDAKFFDSQDFNSENDSYMQIEFGDKKLTDEKVIQDKNDPSFFSKFEFEHKFPGASDLKIKFYDEDFLKRDDLIGETVIDLERRYYDQRWQKLKNKPIETRQIYHPSIKSSRGNCRLWVEIFPKSQIGNFENWNISPRPSTDLELRVVIWDAHDVPSSDFEDVSDIYVSAGLPSFNVEARTDTHYRAQNQYGSFNWRLIFKLKIDQFLKPEDFRIDFKIYDKDFLKRNDYIADVTLDISSLINDVLQYEGRRAFLGMGLDGTPKSKQFKLDCLINQKLRKKKDDDGEGNEEYSKLVCSVDCLTAMEAELSPAGIGRSNPNQDPYLPSPTSRFIFSLNPFKLISQLCGPHFKKQLCWVTCLVLLVVFIFIFLPTLVAAIVAKSI